MERFAAIGAPAPRVEGPQRVSGAALYSADRVLPGMVWGQALRSPLAHARISSIDASRAAFYPGVLAVVTATDLPDALVGRRLRDMPMLARERVRFIGKKVVPGRREP